MSTTEIVRSVPQDAYLISPIMNLSLAKQRLAEFQGFVKDYLVDGEDFGKIPGAPKPTLLKPGADKLCELYGLSDDYEFIERVEDYDRSIFDYTIKCVLRDRRTGAHVSSGLGSCNSLESKYRWRDSKRLCPQCGKDSIIKGKEEYGGGWLCFAKKGGCGAKFSPDDKAITEQTIGRAQNEDVADLKNTILKMAKKRSKIDATLSATRSSGVFTQDIEDMPHMQEEAHTEKAASAEPGADNPRTEPSNVEADRVKWLDAVGPMSPEEFVANVVGHLNPDAAKTLVRCADNAVLSSIYNRIKTAGQFSAFLVPLQKVAHAEGNKAFIKATAAEAKNRGYRVNRTDGTYEEGAKQ